MNISLHISKYMQRYMHIFIFYAYISLIAFIKIIYFFLLRKKYKRKRSENDLRIIIKKLIIYLTVLCLVIPFFASAVSTESYSWYFKPSNNNTQPQVIPEVSGFIDNYNTIYLDKPDKNKLYLTFDAGYENGNVEKILNILKEKEVPAAFFILPQIVTKNPELINRMKEEGHLVCNHTKTHRDMSKITDFETFKNEIEQSEKILYETTGYKMDKFYRPPEGRFSEANLDFADRLGYTTVFWSLAYADWDNNNQMNPSRALELITARTHNGCVILLHPNSSTNAEILGAYIDKMKNSGYEFCTLNDFERVSNETEEE